ncbi:hypothetical protein D3C76_1288730 [compost metagenome]
MPEGEPTTLIRKNLSTKNKLAIMSKGSSLYFSPLKLRYRNIGISEPADASIAHPIKSSVAPSSFNEIVKKASFILVPRASKKTQAKNHKSSFCRKIGTIPDKFILATGVF